MTPKEEQSMQRAWCEYRGMEYVEGHVNPLPSDNFEKGYLYGRRDTLTSEWHYGKDDLPTRTFQNQHSMKIYISLPITTCPDKAREKADLVKATLSRQGHIPVNPFDVYAGKDPSYEDYICHDLRTMLDCDGVLFCKGWEDSCGCNIEHDVAMRFKAHGRKDFVLMYE